MSNTTSPAPERWVAGQPVMRLARDGEMEIVISVPEGQIARFRPGQDVAIALWADSATPVAGRVREIAGGADAVTRTFTVRVSVPQAPANARVGMSANIALQQTLDPGLVILPLTALVRRGDTASVWVVDPKSARVRLRPVTLGQYREDGATILAGVAAGDVVVAAGVHKLRADQVVKVTGSPAQVPSPAPAAR